ncbi:hypothetical protein HanXRQr2_Chr16g0729311 [Helianthus annuus]|uniref:Uncharacterized protein n=1 Tax=Helianthus annuus TaxID=4232 RepID=A0A9K3DQD8_HELAN|nr:hypothetical protein HanXRQr2_Chr16g0729311 [Helianthus annuus]
MGDCLKIMFLDPIHFHPRSFLYISLFSYLTWIKYNQTNYNWFNVPSEVLKTIRYGAWFLAWRPQPQHYTTSLLACREGRHVFHRHRRGGWVICDVKVSHWVVGFLLVFFVF